MSDVPMLPTLTTKQMIAKVICNIGEVTKDGVQLDANKAALALGSALFTHHWTCPYFTGHSGGCSLS